MIKIRLSILSRALYACIVFLLAFPMVSAGQSARQHVRKGNRLYNDKKYEEAEFRYRQTLEEDPRNVKGMFNLGNVLYRQGRYDEAAELFEGLTQSASDESVKAFAYHNLGNSFLESEKYAESVEAYKNALRIIPEDEQTRFNLAYAMRMLQEQPPQDQDQGQNEGDDTDQDKDQDQNDSQENQPNQQSQPRPDQITPQDAQKILDALDQKEQKVQENLKNEQKRGIKGRQEKEW